MTAYLIKCTLCSAVFLMAYRFLLERERMHLFNRWYLLLAVTLSFVVPLISIPVTGQPLPAADETSATFLQAQTPATPPSGTSGPEIHGAANTLLLRMIPLLYLLITLILLLRFFRNLYRLSISLHRYKTSWYHGARLMVVNENISSYSFLNTIVISESDYYGDKRLLVHELAHTRQKHSLDILFIELVKVFCWFNPVFILYKKAMQLNHEFLADEAVIKTGADIPAYQHLLLDKISLLIQPTLTSSFNYSVTKKRLVMMTTTTSRATAVLKQMIALPLLSLVVAVFSTKTIAQEKPPVKEKRSPEVIKDGAPSIMHPFLKNTPFTKEGISRELFNEYKSIEEKYLHSDAREGLHANFNKVTDADRNRMESLFLKMNRDQQSQVHIFFMPPLAPMGKQVPTAKQLESWKKASVYGMWIDEKRVENAALDQYQPADFSHYIASKLSKNAINYGKHYVQVDLMTNAYYDDYYKKTVNNKRYTMVFTRQTKQ